MIPYSEEFETEEFRIWYKQTFPKNLRYGRLPSLNEFKTALEANLPDGYQLGVSASSTITHFSIDSEFGNHNLLSIEISGLKTANPRYSFRGKRTYLAELIKKLPPACGSFLLITNGENPELITAGLDFTR